ncbi:DUF397 domain-containing protein [Streptomyces sp. BHT-5-2]|uniref:DUF397 domain-containing protein n=1 Tax=unclassified Streptomyces TaxID=2593676 RepID=UPI0003600020|nr:MULTISPECIES: DUF397 domain-containing protein [unclassified Streptomyces]MYT34417.1 DUF397 domain-containing protein [Streptomyces sp. SID8354]QZL06317.1 DUF397 domain-containing protein [Streptomyces sp. BHT-5-2]
MGTAADKEWLYSLDISDATWQRPPGDPEAEAVEIAFLERGAVAMRNSKEPEVVLRYTEAEWRAFVLGARDGEFDLDRHHTA